MIKEKILEKIIEKESKCKVRFKCPSNKIFNYRITGLGEWGVDKLVFEWWLGRPTLGIRSGTGKNKLEALRALREEIKQEIKNGELLDFKSLKHFRKFMFLPELHFDEYRNI